MYFCTNGVGTLSCGCATEESEPLDYAAELGSRPPARLVLANRQTEGTGVSPGGPVAEGMRTDTQAETLDGTADLIVPLPTGRDLDEHSHGEGIARQGEQLDRCRHRLQVDYLGPAGNDHQVGSPGGLQRGRKRPRRRGSGDDGERGLPAIAPTAGRGLRVEVEDDRAHLDRQCRRERRLSGAAL